MPNLVTSYDQEGFVVPREGISSWSSAEVLAAARRDGYDSEALPPVEESIFYRAGDFAGRTLGRIVMVGVGTAKEIQKMMEARSE